MKERTHIHHIIPRHVTNGVANNHPDNLVELTILDHAIAHKVLFGLYGRKQDEIAWKCMSGKLTNEEARIQAVKISKNHKEAAKNLCLERNKNNNPMKKGMTNKGSFQKGRTFIMSEKHRQNIAKSMIGNKSTTGMIWITNGFETRFSAGEIPVGWRRGRK